MYVKGTPEQERAPQLKVFLDRWNDVETGITVKFFTTLGDLAQAVTHALEVMDDRAGSGEAAEPLSTGAHGTVGTNDSTVSFRVATNGRLHRKPNCHQ